MKRAQKLPVPALELTWAAHRATLQSLGGRVSRRQRLFPPQPFPSVTADSRRLGNDRGRAARRGAEGKAPAGSDATGLGSG